MVAVNVSAFSVMLNPSKPLTCENFVRILRGHV